jgi:SulP family sulfate permease
MLIGLAQTGITLLRMGDLSRFISNAVIVGFTLGATVLLVLDQSKHLLGLQAHEGDHFLTRFWLTILHGSINYVTTCIGLGTILLVLGIGWLNQKWRVQIPGFLLAMVFMALLVGLLGLDQHGEVAVIGEIPRSLPGFHMPEMDWNMIRNLSPSALAIALLGLLEAIAMAKAIASRTGQKLDINQQCLSEGLANLTGSFFQCFPGSGSLTRSAINQQAGAVSQWSGVIAAIAVAATVLLFAPLARYIPRASLAGILVVSAWRLVDRPQLRLHLRTTRFDARIVWATALSAVVISVEFSILIGVFLSFLMYVPRAAQLILTELIVTPERILRERTASDPSCGRILIFSLEGEFFFGSAPGLQQHLEGIEKRAESGIQVIVFRVKRIRNPDAVCLQILDEFIRKMRDRKITVLLCGVRRDLAKALRRSGLETTLGPEYVFAEIPEQPTSSTLEAVRKAYDLLKGDVCSICPRSGQAADKEVLYYMI